MADQAIPIKPFEHIEHKKIRSALQFIWDWVRILYRPVAVQFIDGDITLGKSRENMFTVSGATTTVDVTLDPDPYNGQMYDVFCIDATNRVRIIGTVNGEVNPTMCKEDSFRMVYHSDTGEWGLR